MRVRKELREHRDCQDDENFTTRALTCKAATKPTRALAETVFSTSFCSVILSIMALLEANLAKDVVSRQTFLLW